MVLGLPTPGKLAGFGLEGNLHQSGIHVYSPFAECGPSPSSPYTSAEFLSTDAHTKLRQAVWMGTLLGSCRMSVRGNDLQSALLLAQFWGYARHSKI